MLIRYPGSKDRQASIILPALELDDRRLCEPFCGTAAVTFACLRAGLLDQAWLNDLDRGIFDLWCTVRDYPDELCTRIAAYLPTAESFYELREVEFDSPVDNAFATVALHQISFSGLGRRAGSPIGGRKQTGAYKVDCRWNADRLMADVRECSSLMRKAKVTITNLDWTDCPQWVSYFDPPYVVAGPDLYREGVFSVRALRDDLYCRTEWWALSYDDVPEVQAAFHWAHVDSGYRTYLAGYTRKHELLITPRPPRSQLAG